MARVSPLRRLHQEAEASLVAYGPEEVDQAVQLVETFGELDMEYAALRKNCVVIDQPNRGVLELTGAARLDFLNRMLTQELAGMAPFRVRRSFWLNKKGRIDADLRVIDLPSRTLLEMDIHAVNRTREGLAGYLVTEDVGIRDISESVHRLAVHGPTAFELLKPLSQHAGGADASGPAFEELRSDRACVIRLAGAECVVFRDDATGEIGLEIMSPVDSVGPLYQQFLEIGLDPDHGDTHGESRGDAPPPTGRRALGSKIRLKPAGWHAFNISRIEAGRPLFNLDFGTESLPAETGVINDRVSFTKGCYLGQEIVARMHSRGHPKQQLVAIRFDAGPELVNGFAKQPVSGSPLWTADSAEGAEPVGQVTSSTISPMLGASAICFAQVKFAHTGAGTTLVAEAEGEKVKGQVQSGLMFWKKTEGMI